MQDTLFPYTQFEPKDTVRSKAAAKHREEEEEAEESPSSMELAPPPPPSRTVGDAEMVGKR